MRKLFFIACFTEGAIAGVAAALHTNIAFAATAIVMVTIANILVLWHADRNFNINHDYREGWPSGKASDLNSD